MFATESRVTPFSLLIMATAATVSDELMVSLNDVTAASVVTAE